MYGMYDKYDRIINPKEHPELEYGIISGGPETVFIKLPRGASINGYGEKYLGLARNLNFYRYATVVCANNVSDELSAEYDVKVVKNYIEDHALGGGEICSFIGIGEGAEFGLAYLRHRLDLRKMLMINMPISYELGKTVELLDGVDRNKLTFVYGDEDSSYRFTPLLKRLYATVITVKGADHSFTGMRGTFVDLYKMLYK